MKTDTYKVSVSTEETFSALLSHSVKNTNGITYIGATEYFSTSECGVRVVIILGIYGFS